MFSLPRQFYDEMIDHLSAEVPNEGCGLLAGSDGEIRKHYRAANAEHSPVLYSIDPKELYSYIKDMDPLGWDIMAIYHSHTHSEAYPSATDVRLGFYPDAIYIIVSLTDPNNPVIRGFHIAEGTITEETIKIV